MSFPPRIKYGVNSSGNPEQEDWIPPHQVRGRLCQAGNDGKNNCKSCRGELSWKKKSFTIQGLKYRITYLL